MFFIAASLLSEFNYLYFLQNLSFVYFLLSGGVYAYHGSDCSLGVIHLSAVKAEVASGAHFTGIGIRAAVGAQSASKISANNRALFISVPLSIQISTF